MASLDISGDILRSGLKLTSMQNFGNKITFKKLLGDITFRVQPCCVVSKVLNSIILTVRRVPPVGIPIITSQV